MLGFFRKYQYYVYLVVTVVIVISFSFFGTYSALPSASVQDRNAFNAIDGSTIKQSQLEQLVLFIRTDREEKRQFGGYWGPNFLNDGVVANDLLKTGIGEILLNKYSDEVKSDLNRRSQSEQHFKPYVHPQARFLSLENIWTYLAPDINTNYQKFQEISDPNSPEGHQARIDLYLAQKKLPGHQVRGILRQQERQYQWITPDPDLDRENLSLFGYTFAEDWFGQRYMRLVGEFIINSAIIAEKQGYKVSKEEALQDLMRNAQISYQENLGSPGMKVNNYMQYMDQQLHRMGMDRSTAAKVWRQVLLFRRLYQDVGNSVVVSPLPYEEYLAYAKESVKADIYQLPEELRLNTFRSMGLLETYLDATTESSSKDKLALPTQFHSAEKVLSSSPELAQKRYLLDIASIPKAKLQSKVSIKETWNWEVADANWETLKKRFPELGVKKGDTRKQRFTVLDSLDPTTRERVDAFSRAQIVDTHPEWLQESLDQASPERTTISLRKRGGKTPFAGLKKGTELIALLDKAPLGHEATNESGLAELKQYTADDQTYYQITVIDRSPEWEVMTFAEAQNEGILDEILDRKLDAFYISKRKDSPDGFKQSDGSWKQYFEVKDKVGELYFADQLKELQKYHSANLADSKAMTSTALASARLHPYVESVRQQIVRNPDQFRAFTKELKEPAPHNTLPDRDSVVDQWKLEKTTYHTDRSNEGQEGHQGIFNLAVNEWSKVYHARNGEVFFFNMLEKGEPEEGNQKAIAKKVREAHNLLSSEAQQVLATELLAEMKEAGAISLDFMAGSSDEEEEGDVEEL